MLLVACDQGEPELTDARGPALHLVAAFPEPNAGLDCEPTSPDTCGVARNTSLQFRFDRYLAPGSTVRQAIRVSGGGEVFDFSEPDYDVVERVVSYRFLGNLEAGLVYTVELLSPSEDDPNGFAAFDGAALAPGDVPLTFQFRTQRADPPVLPMAPAPPSCKDVFDSVLSGNSNGTCGSGQCHGSEPRMGLSFATQTEFAATAINRVAHETETGAQGGVTLENPVRVGVQMPIIDPGRPDNSYIMYKLLRRSETFAGDCTSKLAVALPPGQCPEPSAEESARLREWFVRGEPMPLADDNPDTSITITTDHLRSLQAFIRAGASCP